MPHTQLLTQMHPVCLIKISFFILSILYPNEFSFYKIELSQKDTRKVSFIDMCIRFTTNMLPAALHVL